MMMRDKLGISCLFVEKALILLLLKRILAGNAKHAEIRVAACLVQLSGARREDLGCRDLVLHDKAEQFPAFLLTHRLTQEPQYSQLLHLETFQKWI